ncbi:DcaP family trimeric outer membrane transporter [Brevundimonas sp. Root1279]|uniref:DcaP family trimeric outer membrane transporter n=1 Tax=Brevundimonas sp. Root1279 TaxID=1736443 RepID=UPI000AB5DA5A|nr:DcaP family trimeric outer membrane transporter [Brevundimonas sp. Root1279]
MRYLFALGCLGATALSSPALAADPEPQVVQTAAPVTAAASAAPDGDDERRRQDIRAMRAQIEELNARVAAMEAEEGLAPPEGASVQRLVYAPDAGVRTIPVSAPRPWSPMSLLADDGHKFEVYGFAQADVIYDVNRVDPAWEDAFRPSKIPTTEDAFGSDGQTSISVKQSRLGVRASGDAGGRPYEGRFEFDLFGTGVDAGQTTFRLRHAYGRWGPILAGQTNSLFMDGDLFPNTIDYWGPTGMVFLRNPQVRWIIRDRPDFYAAVAVEKPGNDIDAGLIRQIDPDLGAGLTNTEKLPDVTGQLRYQGDWGHAQVSGILRQIGFETVGAPNNEPDGNDLGWGINLGTAYTTGPATFRLGAVFGEGIASYMNDGGMDLAPQITVTVIPPGLIDITGEGQAVPLFGMTAYLDYAWNEHWTSAFGYSFTQVDNTNFQEPGAFHRGEYASANILWAPTPRIMTGAELLWGKRTDNDGATGDDIRLQFSFKVSFSSNDFFKE